MRAQRDSTVHHQKFIGVDVFRSRSNESTESVNGKAKHAEANEPTIIRNSQSPRIATEDGERTVGLLRRDIGSIFRPRAAQQPQQQRDSSPQKTDMFTLKRCLAFDEDEED